MIYLSVAGIHLVGVVVNQEPSVATRPCVCLLGRGSTKVISAAISLSERGRALTELSATMPEPHLQQPGSVQGPLRTRVVRSERPDLSVRESFTKENVEPGDVA